MNHTYLFSLLVSFVFAPLAACQEKGEAQVTCVVVDEAGAPIPGAKIDLQYFDHWQPGPEFGKDVYKEMDQQTDAKGNSIFRVSTPRGDFGGEVHKAGYYNAGWGYEARSTDGRDIPIKGRWEPWNPTIKIQLKKILHPIPLIARRVDGDDMARERLPAPLGKTASFDMEVSDWTPPYGKGKVADLVFMGTRKEWEDAWGDGKKHRSLERTLTVEFSNPKDGFIICHAPKVSDRSLRMPHHAPKEGYLPVLTKHHFVLPPVLTEEEKERLAKRPDLWEYVKPHSDLKESPDECLFLRLRTKTNEKGEIVSAHYAKIHGGMSEHAGAFDWEMRGKPGEPSQCYLRFTYYYNPTPNDTNLEFDPTRNLLAVEYQSKPKPTFKPSDSELDKAEEMRFWESAEANRKEKALEKLGGNVKEP